MLMSWLWNSVHSEISGTCMFLTTMKEIWEFVKQSYFNIQDAVEINEIKTKISSIEQGTLFIIEYYNILKTLWLELDYYQNFKMKCSEDATMLLKFDERERIF